MQCKAEKTNLKRLKEERERENKMGKNEKNRSSSSAVPVQAVATAMKGKFDPIFTFLFSFINIPEWFSFLICFLFPFYSSVSRWFGFLFFIIKHSVQHHCVYNVVVQRAPYSLQLHLRLNAL